MPFNLVSDQKEQENASESRRIKEFEGLALVGALCGTGMGAVPIIHHSKIKRIECNMIQGITPAKLFAAFPFVSTLWQNLFHRNVPFTKANIAKSP